MQHSILFVCLGNICRSPLAQGIAESYCSQHFSSNSCRIDSAGTGSWHIGEPPCERSIKTAQKHHIDIKNQRARQVQLHDAQQYSIIIALDRSNQDNLKKLGISSTLLGDYGLDGIDIPDPYFFNDIDGFEEVFSLIEKAVHHLIDHLTH